VLVAGEQAVVPALVLAQSLFEVYGAGARASARSRRRVGRVRSGFASARVALAVNISDASQDLLRVVGFDVVVRSGIEVAHSGTRSGRAQLAQRRS
jgi:hypothetical protein